MTERVETGTTSPTKVIKPRLGVLVRNATSKPGERSEHYLSAELQTLTDQYKKVWQPQCKNLAKALKQRHAVMLKNEDARMSVREAMEFA